MAALDGASSEALGIALLVLIPISLTQLLRVRSFYITKMDYDKTIQRPSKTPGLPQGGEH